LEGQYPAKEANSVGGYIYGPVWTTIYSVIGLSIGSWLAFILARTYGLPLVRRVVRPLIMEKYGYFMGHQGRFIPFMLFLIPGFPKAALYAKSSKNHSVNCLFWDFPRRR
jgi:uncharacterized membrane protein YdjX (TVP38/TMEM64 family)